MSSSQTRIKTPDGVQLDTITVTPQRADAPWVVLAHGITVDREEEGAFAHLASHLTDRGYGSVRFSFRGHGQSSVPSSEMTISGEASDLKAVVDQTLAKRGRIAAIVAASFGAVSTSLLARYLESRVSCIVLWNPVLSLRDTFTRPKTSWGRKNFSGHNIKNVFRTGAFRIDGEFQVGVVFWEELHHFKPAATLAKTATPLLILHGDHDTYVPFGVAKHFAKRRPNTEFIAVVGSDHGFPTARSERFAIDQSVKFIQRHTA